MPTLAPSFLSHPNLVLTLVPAQVRSVEREEVTEFVMTVVARERTEAGREARASLAIRVEARDTAPPVLKVSAGNIVLVLNSFEGLFTLPSLYILKKNQGSSPGSVQFKTLTLTVTMRPKILHLHLVFFP